MSAFAGLLGSASPFFVILAAASLLLGARGWSRELAELCSAGWPRAMAIRLGLQLASFAGLFGASVNLFGYPETVGGLQVALWLLALFATLVCWLALWAPWTVWRPNVAIVPLAEELAFRGFVMRRLTSPAVEQVRWSQVSLFALIAQAVLFGLLHPQHLLGGWLVGIAFGWIALRTRSGSAPFLAHALTNALVLALAAWTKRWDWV